MERIDHISQPMYQMGGVKCSDRRSNSFDGFRKGRCIECREKFYIMKKPKFKYIYGPVQSWRMGKSLGIDPLTETSKTCNLNCIYCQLGKTRALSDERKVYVPTEEMMKEVDALPSMRDVDYFTFSGRGEPTLASNLGEMIQAVKRSKRNAIAVITNSTFMHLSDVRMDLSLSDYVIAKLDACDDLSFSEVNQAMKGVRFAETLDGIKIFKKDFQGKLAIQMMFVEENKKYVRRIADIVRDINPDEIQINTPLRPAGVKPLTQEEIQDISSHFYNMPTVTVYDYDQKETVAFDEKDTMKRHGHYHNPRGELCR